MTPDDPGIALPTAEAVARLDRAAEAARENPADPEIGKEVWRAAFALENWMFIARGTEDAPVPYARVLDEGPMVFAFSTPERAHDAGLAVGLSEEEASLILGIPLPAAVDWLVSFAESGVAGVIFDPATSGFAAPLANLRAIRDGLAAE